MRIRPVTLFLTGFLLAGCATLEIPKTLPLLKKDPLKAKPEVPARLIAVWSDAVYTEAGKPAVRGFGGRLYFHNAKDKAVPVQGQLVVYGYNDSVDGTPSRQPDRKFAFTAEQLAKHLTAGELGVSYSIWIPWEPVGGYKKTVTLLPVFTTAKGISLTGQQTVNSLPGKTPDTSEPPAGRRNPSGLRESAVIQPASYQQPATARSGGANAGDLSPPEAPRRRLQATSIQLPVTMQRMIENAGPQPPPAAAAANVAQTLVAGEGNPPPTVPGEPADNAPNSHWQPTGLPRPAVPGVPVGEFELSRSGITAPPGASQAESPPTRFERPRLPAQAVPSGR